MKQRKDEAEALQWRCSGVFLSHEQLVAAVNKKEERAGEEEAGPQDS